MCDTIGSILHCVHNLHKTALTCIYVILYLNGCLNYFKKVIKYILADFQ